MKILKIVANNFKLCSKDFTISFLPIANKTAADKEFELIEIAEDLFVFSTVGIIGQNASGKTTVVNLISLVHDLFTFHRVNLYADSILSWEKDVNIDVTFYYEGYLYRYVTDLTKDKSSIQKTVLFKNQELYKKKYVKTNVNKIFDYDKYDKIEVNENLPNDVSILYLIFKNQVISGLTYSLIEYENPNFKSAFDIYNIIDKDYKLIEKIIKLFDKHIKRIEMIEDNKYKIYYTNKEVKEVSIALLINSLSSGTKKGFLLFSLVVYSLKTGCDLIIDEIENHFHKTLVENLVSLYKDKTVNRHNATLIFTTHYCELLDLFNRYDNLYITKYDKDIVLENIYANFKIRPELSKSKKFYENAFNTAVDYDALMDFKKELM